MKFNNIRIGTRLFISFGAVVLLTVILACASYWAFSKVSLQWNSFHTVSLRKADAVAEGHAMLASANENFKNFLLRGDAYKMNFMADLGGVEFAASSYAGFIPENGPEKAALDRVTAGTAKYLAGMRKASELKGAGAPVEEIERAVKGIDTEIKIALDELTQITRDETKAAGDAINTLVATGKRIIFFAAVACILLGVLFARLTSKSITRPLNEAVKIAQTVATGDLSAKIEITTKDETGALLRALKDMNQSLVKIVGEVRAGTDTIATASSQIASGNLDLSSRTEIQASSLEETASSMEELTSTVSQNADNARLANGLAVTASEVATKGGAVVSQVVATMGSINDSSKKIVDIISVIDAIAFQTNILALNAAVEAARAGDQGRGFAVVAAEVRNLAHRSSSAAREIKLLINDSVEKVHAGNELVDQAGATMQEVVASVQRVTSIMAEIMAASEEQSAGIAQVNLAIGQVDDITQQNAALVEEATAAAKSMQDQSKALAHLVSVFKLSATDKLQSRSSAASTEVSAALANTPGKSEIGASHESHEDLPAYRDIQIPAGSVRRLSPPSDKTVER